MNIKGNSKRSHKNLLGRDPQVFEDTDRERFEISQDNKVENLDENESAAPKSKPDLLREDHPDLSK